MIKRELSSLCIDDEDYMTRMMDCEGAFIIIELLGRLRQGEYVENTFTIPKPDDLAGIDVEPQMRKNRLDTSGLMQYVKMLKDSGYNIGKGDSEFGYRMPLPKRKSNTRVLQIFRRR